MKVDLSAEMASTPLTLDEVDELLSADARAVLSDAAAPRVLLGRVRASMRRDVEDKKRLRNDVARVTEAYKMKSSPLAAAVEALGRLNPAEQAEVFTIGAVGLLETLRSEIVDARAVSVAAASAQNRARLVLSTLLERGHLTGEDETLVRDELDVLDATTWPALGDAHMAPVNDPIRVAAAGAAGAAGEVVPLADLFS